jgi:hypothetical protein
VSTGQGNSPPPPIKPVRAPETKGLRLDPAQGDSHDASLHYDRWTA